MTCSVWTLLLDLKQKGMTDGQQPEHTVLLCAAARAGHASARGAPPAALCHQGGGRMHGSRGGEAQHALVSLRWGRACFTSSSTAQHACSARSMLQLVCPSFCMQRNTHVNPGHLGRCSKRF